MTHKNKKGGNALTVIPKGLQPDRASENNIGQIHRKVNNSACDGAENSYSSKRIHPAKADLTSLPTSARQRPNSSQIICRADWEGLLDTLLTSNELPHPLNARTALNQRVERIAHERCSAYDEKRGDDQAFAASKINEMGELKRVADATRRRSRGANYE